MIKSRKDLKKYIAQDRIMNNKKAQHVSMADMVKSIILPDLVIKYLYLLRKAEYYNNCHKHCFILSSIYKLMYRHLGTRLGYTIPLNTFGPGLSLPHIGTIVVNGNAKVGSNCRLHVCVNIGASGGSLEAPKLGDNVYIGPGAILYGDISIANNVTIGANATVNRSCEQENVVLAGTPAKIVKENYPNWVEFNNVPLDDEKIK